MSGAAAGAERPELLAVSEYQAAVLSVPQDFDLFLGGGRGGGKSWACAQLVLRHCHERGALASALYVRQSYPGMLDFEAVLRELVPLAFPGATYSAQSHVWRLPSGARVELGILESPADLTRYQGRSFTLVLVDEAGEWPDLSLAERLRANLRGPAGVPLRVVVAANPGGPGHAQLYRRFVAGREPWEPFAEEASGRSFVYCPSTYRENPYLDGGAYARNLEASCAGDPELLKAWRDGDWAIARGAFFAAVLDERRVATPAWSPAEWEPFAREFRPANARSERPADYRPDLFLAHDFGSAAPSVTFVAWRSDGRAGLDGRFYAAGSLVLLDELATCEPGSLSRGLGWTVPKLAEAVRDLAAPWGCGPSGVADDAIFARTGSGAGSISDEFRREGVYFAPARKADRRTGWESMRSMLAAAGRPDVPGLYVSRRCGYWWATVPALPRDPRRPEDVDTRAADHAADACRYALGRERSLGGVASTLGILGY